MCMICEMKSDRRSELLFVTIGYVKGRKRGTELVGVCMLFERKR